MIIIESKHMIIMRKKPQNLHVTLFIIIFAHTKPNCR